jgi:hypothetical protein
MTTTTSPALTTPAAWHVSNVLDVQPDLFGQWCFIREWCRIGRSGQGEAQCSSFHRVRFVRLFFGVHDGVNDGRLGRA